MRWRVNDPKDDPKVGTIRIDSGFLFFPKSINNEVRWLEFATWEEKCVVTYSSSGVVWDDYQWL